MATSEVVRKVITPDMLYRDRQSSTTNMHGSYSEGGSYSGTPSGGSPRVRPSLKGSYLGAILGRSLRARPSLKGSYLGTPLGGSPWRQLPIEAKLPKHDLITLLELEICVTI